jgi:hypothetical protein
VYLFSDELIITVVIDETAIAVTNLDCATVVAGIARALMLLIGLVVMLGKKDGFGNVKFRVHGDPLRERGGAEAPPSWLGSSQGLGHMVKLGLHLVEGIVPVGGVSLGHGQFLGDPILLYPVPFRLSTGNVPL